MNQQDSAGAISWMTRNSVAANLLMLLLIVGGLVIGSKVTQEVFPELDLDTISIVIPYPGASPEEVENGILLAVEEAIQGAEGIKKVTSRASEGSATVLVSLLLGTDPDKALADVKNSIDRIVSFPGEAERPTVSLLTSRMEVQSLVLYGDQSEAVLRAKAEELRLSLLAAPEVSQVDLAGVKPLEISIEVSKRNLRRYGLTLEQIANRVREASIELPGGSVKTRGGEVLVRTNERRVRGEEFERIRLINTPDGSSVFLGNVATIRDGFQESDEAAFFNGKPAIMVKVFRVGDQTPIEVSRAIQRQIKQFEKTLPDGIGVAVWQDISQMYSERLDLLLRNAAMGLILVFVVLGLFLEIRLAFWVTVGIPISFLGSLLFLPAVDVSINMISLFSFLLTLGIVVDDAIVVGENVFQHRERGLSPIQAAITGAREIAIPVTFSILTTLAAFLPMFFIPGVSGKFFRVIPATVVIVLAISLVESLFVLPAHLAHLKAGNHGRLLSAFHSGQKIFGNALTWVIEKLYRPLLEASLQNKAITLSAGIAMLLVCGGFVAGGRISFVYMPAIESDVVIANVRLPFGVNVEETKAVQAKVVLAAQEIVKRHGGDSLCRGVFTQVGGTVQQQNVLKSTQNSGNVAVVQLLLQPSGQRRLSAFEIAEMWRQRVGEIPGVEKLSFNGSTGPSTGAPIDVQLRHKDQRVLERSARRVGEELSRFPGLNEIDTGVSTGKVQLDLKVKPVAQSLGINASELARQVRGAFFGVEARRFQRGRDEVRVMVRFPERERCSEQDIQDFVVLTPRGGEVPLFEAAEVKRKRSFTEIVRVDGQRTINVTAQVSMGNANVQQIKAALVKGPLKNLTAQTPNLTISLEGENREQMETAESLATGSLMAMILIYGLLAVPFKSYVQPLVIMAAIPFGFIGVVLGHLLTGYELSIVSMLGVVALAGVVVNDSLVLISTSNSLQDQGLGPEEAVREAGLKRFRPIVLTSLTTFFGLVPMILETSLQARFLIPMAVALGFGVLFATFIILLLVPVLTLLIDEASHALDSLKASLGFTDDSEAEVSSRDH